MQTVFSILSPFHRVISHFLLPPMNVPENSEISRDLAEELNFGNLFYIIWIIWVNIDMSSGHLQWLCFFKLVKTKVCLYNFPEVYFRWFSWRLEPLGLRVLQLPHCLNA